jgi:hydrophobic/amphiphilic exporter-1 (mainly G- bacteria), HAE1 family
MRRKGLLARFFKGFNSGYSKLEKKYQRILGLFIHRKTFTWGLLGLFILFTWGTGSVLPTGFIPGEDQGTIYANVTTPVGATLERTEKVMDEIDEISSTLTMWKAYRR